MEEAEAQQLYSTLLESNKTACAAKLFAVAHHTLAAAMYVGVYLEDSFKLMEVEILVREQIEDINLWELQTGIPPGSIHLSLYQSLHQMVKTRLMLIPKRK